MRILPVGAHAPDFRLRDAVRGGDYALGDLLAKGPLLLRFLHGTHCAACLEDLRGTGALERAAFIVSQDPFEAVSRFASLPEPERPPFPVLVDADRSVAKAYGAYALWSGGRFRIASPTAFDIGTDRIVIAVRAGHAGPGAAVPA